MSPFTIISGLISAANLGVFVFAVFDDSIDLLTPGFYVFFGINAAYFISGVTHV